MACRQGGPGGVRAGRQASHGVVTGRVCLVNGTIRPYWSYAERRELWSRKHATTGFTAQLVRLLDGSVVYISGPRPVSLRLRAWERHPGGM
jgi:hypothetical protein